MNILILAAGYATRLYPLTLTKAKPLLNVAGKPMMEWVIDNLAPIEGIDKVYVVTNSKFAAISRPRSCCATSAGASFFMRSSHCLANSFWSG